MFIGRYEHTIDQKGRTSLPARYRETLLGKYDERLVITNSYSKCLDLYPYKEWERLLDKVNSLPSSEKAVKAFQRFVIAGGKECTVDKQGRILISPTLREFAGLEKEIVFVGVSNKIEIWNKASWEEEFNKSKKTLEEHSDTLADYGL